MKNCNAIKEGETNPDKLNWTEFLQQYFQLLEQDDICFEHMICISVAKRAYELSRKLLCHQSHEVQELFLEEAFSYIFEVLEIIFNGHDYNSRDDKTEENIANLRKHYEYMKQLSELEVVVVAKFCKKIMKNSFILGLYKKYQ